MAIPKEILELKPKNTRVKATSNPNVFNVIKRTCITKNGKPYPVEMGVIGKIVNGEYIPLVVNEYETDFKQYGQYALCEKLNKDIFNSLVKFYDFEDAKKIYVIASLRAMNEDIKNEEIQVEYKTNFISERYSKCALSPNTISKFLDKIGRATTIIETFMDNRLQEFSKNPIVIDGMLKSNTSNTNIFSEYSRKSRIKGTEDLNLIYAYDIIKEEPVASAVYPGNMLDYTAFRDFIKTYPIHNGFLIMDKGFDDNQSKQLMSEQNITFLIPKKLTGGIKKLDLSTGFETSFILDNDTIRAKKICVEDKIYYCYKSTKAKSMQEIGYMQHTNKKGEYSEVEYIEKEKYFGLIVFESNGDLPLKEVYEGYQRRWQIEELFRTFKNILDQSEENVHGTYRVMASEFINFISTIMLCRIRNYLKKKNVLERYSFPSINRFLKKIVKKRLPRKKDCWSDAQTLEYIKDIAKILDI